MAERVGFEPTDGCPSLVFKTSALNHSAISPAGVDYASGPGRARRAMNQDRRQWLTRLASGE